MGKLLLRRCWDHSRRNVDFPFPHSASTANTQGPSMEPTRLIRISAVSFRLSRSFSNGSPLSGRFNNPYRLYTNAACMVQFQRAQDVSCSICLFVRFGASYHVCEFCQKCVWGGGFADHLQYELYVTLFQRRFMTTGETQGTKNLLKLSFRAKVISRSHLSVYTRDYGSVRALLSRQPKKRGFGFSEQNIESTKCSYRSWVRHRKLYL